MDSFFVGLAMGFVMVLILTNCNSYQPSCYDNPRNMSCMTAGELEKELNQ